MQFFKLGLDQKNPQKLNCTFLNKKLAEISFLFWHSTCMFDSVTLQNIISGNKKKIFVYCTKFYTVISSNMLKSRWKCVYYICLDYCSLSISSFPAFTCGVFLILNVNFFPAALLSPSFLVCLLFVCCMFKFKLELSYNRSHAEVITCTILTKW